MKATELRIGNFIEHNGISQRIIGIEGNISCYNNEPMFNFSHLATVRTDITLQSHVFTQEVKPIPLTEEWLTKLGFEKYICNDGTEGWIKKTLFMLILHNLE